MPFAVLLTNDAARDLEELYEYIAMRDTPGKVEKLGQVLKYKFQILPSLP